MREEESEGRSEEERGRVRDGGRKGLVSEGRERKCRKTGLRDKLMDRFVEDTFTLHRCLRIVYVDDVTVATWYDRSKGKPDHLMEQLQLQVT